MNRGEASMTDRYVPLPQWFAPVLCGGDTPFNHAQEAFFLINDP